MELKLNAQETKAVLLAWAEDKFPGRFNSVASDSYHSRVDGVQFSFVQPEPPVALVDSAKEAA